MWFLHQEKRLIPHHCLIVKFLLPLEYEKSSWQFCLLDTAWQSDLSILKDGIDHKFSLTFFSFLRTSMTFYMSSFWSIGAWIAWMDLWSILTSCALKSMNMKYGKGILSRVLFGCKLFQVSLSASCILVRIDFESTFCQELLIQVGIILPTLYFGESFR